MAAGESFYSVLSSAVADFASRGYVSEAQLGFWMQQLRAAAESALMPERDMVAALKQAFGSIYTRLVDRGRILEQHPEIARFRLEQVKPKLRAELNRRILASADLIKLNRQSAVEDTLRRLSGWATSVPPGGTELVARNETKAAIRKSLASLPYVERRVIIDQSHKFATNLSDIVATDAGAIAMIWRHHYSTQPRPEHVARDGKMFLLKSSWARDKGLVKAGENGFYDDTEKVGAAVFCRCSAQWIYNLRAVDSDMLTVKGRTELARVRLVA